MLHANKKKALVEQYKTHDSDTGSPEVQVSILSARISELTGHFKTHPKDYLSRLGLMKLVSQRRKLLNYLKKKDEKRYQKLITSLELRK